MQGLLCPCASGLPAAGTASHSRCVPPSKTALQPQPHRLSLAAPPQIWRHTPKRLLAATSAAAPPAAAGKLLASSVISSFIPRQDLIDQLLRWACIDAQDQGVVNFGLPMTVKPSFRNEDELWGFTVTVHNREGEVLTQLSVRMDNETITKHDFVGRGADGFPTLKGRTEDVDGKNLEIRKLDDNPVDERLRSVLKGFCQALIAAINRYYAFGSPFVEDAQ